MPLSLETLNISAPNQVREFPRGRLELFSIGVQKVGRAVYAPGWRWCEHVAPIVGTPLCEVGHVGLVVSGHVAIKMSDGTELVMGPGDFFSVPPGHDSWVVGNEQYVSLHLLGAEHYAEGPQGAKGGAAPGDADDADDAVDAVDAVDAGDGRAG